MTLGILRREDLLLIKQILLHDEQRDSYRELVQRIDNTVNSLFATDTVL